MGSFQRNDIARERQDSGEQPFKDAREALSQEQAELQAEAEEYGEERFERQSDEERLARIEADAEERLAHIGEDDAKDAKSNTGA